MTDETIMICHECGGRMVRDSRPATYGYRDRAITVVQSGWYCESCGEAVLGADDLAATRPAIAAMRAESDGVLPPAEVRAIRKTLKLTQRQAGALLGGGPNAFQKYESGEAAVSQPMSNLLRLLARDPNRLDELRNG